MGDIDKARNVLSKMADDNLIICVGKGAQIHYEKNSGLPVNPVYFIHFNINEIDFPSIDNYIENNVAKESLFMSLKFKKECYIELKKRNNYDKD